MYLVTANEWKIKELFHNEESAKSRALVLSKKYFDVKIEFIGEPLDTVSEVKRDMDETIFEYISKLESLVKSLREDRNSLLEEFERNTVTIKRLIDERDELNLRCKDMERELKANKILIRELIEEMEKASSVRIVEKEPHPEVHRSEAVLKEENMYNEMLENELEETNGLRERIKVILDKKLKSNFSKVSKSTDVERDKNNIDIKG